MRLLLLSNRRVQRYGAPLRAAWKSPLSLAIVPVQTSQQWRDFHHLPFKIYADDPHWVAPLLLERKFHFDPHLVQAFTHCIGIYPTGTLVRLESGRLGVVTEQHERNLLTPVVKVFFSTRSMSYVTPETVDLSKKMGAGGADRIVNHESPEKWQIDVRRFM